MKRNWCTLILGIGLTFSPAWLLFAQPPLGTPDVDDIEYPDDEPPDPAVVSLGKTLFFDTRLSKNQKMSCATCHNPDLGFGDGFGLGLGSEGNRLGRNTPHLYNLAWNVLFFWDGRAASLEDQALGPIEAEGEMNMNLDDLIPRLQKVPEYVEAFRKAFPAEQGRIDKHTLAAAIAGFERTLISDDSPFDRYLEGDAQAMSEEAKRGLALFKGKAKCINCHNGPNLTDNGFHNIGVGDGKDPGRGSILAGVTTQGAFKTPGLRNVVLTAPYMHDGSVGSLEAVVRHYVDAPKQKKNLSPLMVAIELDDFEILDLVAFMGALTDPVEIKPPVVP
ncbi:C-type cytochrome [Sulfidibacter corallicola]|uniref:Methylamine utilization protein MauG n=1 Tax=Sulfidibacter corallicola TaxID=2818388 RepID=A0A8A4TE98_SULCO|nr:cytochrome c peroxidase [Sulfidibacter corallicola]QTD48429.1 c-type cytochrome [Sulfidibacter corallicola]